MNKYFTLILSLCACLGLTAVGAQTTDDLNYPVGEELENQMGGNAWSGPWKQYRPDNEVGSNGSFMEGGITTVNGLTSSGNHFGVVHNPGDSNKRFARGLTTPITDDGNTYYLSFFMESSWGANSGSVSYVMLVDTASLAAGGPGGQLVQIGRRFSNPFLSIAKGGTVDDSEVRADAPHFVVVQIDMSGDDSNETIWMYVDPDTSSPLDTMMADKKSTKYALNDGFNGLGIKVEGGGQLTTAIDEIRFGANLADVVAADLTVVPVGAQENFNYSIDSTIASSSGSDNGWGGPWQIVKGADPVIVEGGFENLSNLTTTSGNRTSIDFSAAPNTRIFRPLNTDFQDDGSVYYVSFSTQNIMTNVNGTVSYLMLVDKDSYAASGPNGQLAQIGKYLNTNKLGVGVGSNFDFTAANSDEANMVVAKIITSGDDGPDRIELFVNPTGTEEPDSPDAAWEYGTALNNGFDAIGIKVEGNVPGIVAEFDDIYVGFDFSSVIPTDLGAVQNPIAAFVYDQFNYVPGDTLKGSGGATNGWAGPWADNDGNNNAVIGNPIVNDNLLVRTSGNAAELTGIQGSNAYQRLFEVPIDTVDGSFWFATHMQAGGSISNNIGNVALIDTSAGGQALQVILGKQFNTRNIFATGNGTGGAATTGAQFSGVAGNWIVAHMDWIADSSRWELDVWVDPDPSSTPLEADANIQNKRYAARNYHGALIRTDGAPGLEWKVDDLYFGRQFQDIVPLDLALVAPAPAGANENFDYDPTTALIGAEGGTGFAGSYELLTGTGPTIKEGGISNFFLLKETSSNKLGVNSGENARIVRALEGSYGDSGREYWLGWFFDANGSGGNVAHLVLADTATYEATGPGGQLAQIGQLFGGGIGIVAAPGGTAAGVASDTAHFMVVNIVTNGTIENDDIYLWVDPDLSTTPSRDTALVKAKADLTNWNGLGFKVEGDPGVSPEWDDILLADEYQDIIPIDLGDLDPPAIPKPGFDVFDYTAGSDLDLQEGGEGWSSAWSSVAGTAVIGEGAIESDRVNQEGNKVVISQSGMPTTYTRNFFNPFTNGEVWVSVLLDVSQKDIGNRATVSLYNGETEVLGVGGVAGISKFAAVYGDQQLTATNAEVIGTNWVVMRLKMDGTEALDQALIWLNPSADAIPADEAALFTIDDIDLNAGVATLALKAEGAQSVEMAVDAFRIGFSYRDISNQFGSDDPNLIAFEPFNYDAGAAIIGSGGINAFWEGPWFDKSSPADETNIALIDEGSLTLEGAQPIGNKAQLSYNAPNTQIRIDRQLAFPFASNGDTYWLSFLQFTDETIAVNNVGNITLRDSGLPSKDGQIMAVGRMFGSGKIGIITPQNNNNRETELEDVGLNWLVTKISTSADDTPDTVALWVNPSPSVEPDTVDADLLFLTDKLKGGFDMIRLKAEGANADQVPYTTFFDELRLAKTFASASLVTNTIEVEPSDPFLLKAFPNPAKDHITVLYHLDNPGRSRLELFDIRGASVGVLHDGVQPPGEQQFDMELDNLSNGIYFLRLIQGGKATTRKLIIYRF